MSEGHQSDGSFPVTCQLLLFISYIVLLLKQWHLSGILESIERRNREAIEQKMAYPEFLALVFQEEAARLDHNKYTPTAP